MRDARGVYESVTEEAVEHVEELETDTYILPCTSHYLSVFSDLRERFV